MLATSTRPWRWRHLLVNALHFLFIATVRFVYPLLGYLSHASSLALAASRTDLIDSVIAEKVPAARDVLLKELGRRKEKVSCWTYYDYSSNILNDVVAAGVHASAG